MHAMKLTVGLLAAATVSAVGCAIAPKERGGPPAAADRRPASPAAASAGAQGDVQPGPAAKAPPVPTAQAGSGGAAPDSSLSGVNANKAPSLQEVIAEVEALGDVNPEVQKRLLEELRNCDPALWPLVAQQVRAALAYQKQQIAKAAGNAASAGPGADLKPGFPAAASGPPPSALVRDASAKPIAAPAAPKEQAAKEQAA